jgi:hypothetical protein
VEQTSWEDDNHSTSQEFPRLLWKPKVHYRLHNSSSLLRIISQINPIHNFQPFPIRSIVILSSHGVQVFGMISSLQVCDRNFVCLSPVSHFLYVPKILAFLDSVILIFAEAWKDFGFLIVRISLFETYKQKDSSEINLYFIYFFTSFLSSLFSFLSLYYLSLSTFLCSLFSFVFVLSFFLSYFLSLYSYCLPFSLLSFLSSLFFLCLCISFLYFPLFLPHILCLYIIFLSLLSSFFLFHPFFTYFLHIYFVSLSCFQVFFFYFLLFLSTFSYFSLSSSISVYYSSCEFEPKTSQTSVLSGLDRTAMLYCYRTWRHMGLHAAQHPGRYCVLFVSCPPAAGSFTLHVAGSSTSTLLKRSQSLTIHPVDISVPKD